MARSLAVEVAMKVAGLPVVKDAVSGIKELGAEAGISAGMLAGLGAAGAVAFQQITKYQKEANSATKAYQIATGDSKAAALEFEDAMSHLDSTTAATGFTFDEVAKAGTAVAQQFDLSGAASEDLTAQFLAFSRVTGADAVQSVESFDAALDAFGLPAEAAAGLMDQLTASSQKYGTDIGPKAVDTMAKMAPALTAMGLGAEDAVAMLNLFEEAGINADTAQRGLNSAIANIPPGQTFDDVVASLGAIEDPAQRATAATEIFGTTMGPKMALAIQPGMTSLSEFGFTAEEAAGKTDAASDLLANTTAGKFEAFGGTVAGVMRDLGQAFSSPIATLNQLIPVINLAGGAFGGLKTAIVPLIPVLTAALGPAIAGIAAVLAPLLPVILAVAAAIAALKVVGELSARMFDKHTEAVKTFTAASQADTDALIANKTAVDGLSKVLNFVAPWSNAAKAAKGTSDAYADAEQRAVDAGYEIKSMEQILSESDKAWQRLAGGVLTAAKGIGSSVSDMARGVQTALQDFGKWGRDAANAMIDGLVGGIRGGVDRVVGAAKDVAGRVKDILKLGSPAKEGPWAQEGGPIAWMERNGRMMVDGLARGLASGGAINVPQFGAGIGGLRVNASGSRALAPIVVNVYAGVGDPVEIGREVSNALRAYQRVSGTEA